MALIAFDIETGPVKPEHGLKIRPFNKGRLVDEKKIEAAREKHIDKFALFPTTGEVLTIQYCTKDGVLIETRRKYTEEQLIQRFWELWRSTERRSHLFCGHSICRFDLPFLINRSRILDIEYPGDLQKGRYFNSRFKDLQEIWDCGVYGNFTSLDEICVALGWQAKPAEAREFHRIFKEEPELAMDYCRHDAVHTYRLAQLLLGGF